MRVDNSARSGGIIGISFRVIDEGMLCVLFEAILMCTYNIQFSI